MIRELLKEITREDMARVGMVKGVDEENLTVDVQLEREEKVRKSLPIRVMKTQDDLGIYIIPKVGTEVLVLFVDARPTPIAFQEWEKIIVKRSDGFRLEIERSGKVELENPQGARITIDGKNVEADGLSSFRVRASQVELGNSAIGGVITDKTLPACIFSGAPMVNFSSKTVKGSS